MFRIQYLLLIAAAALCSCATERTVATNFQPRQRPDSEKTDAELMDALEAKFAGGFGQQTDKEGNTRMVSQKRSSFEGLGTAATRLKSKKRLLKPHPLKKRNLTAPPPGLKRRNGMASNPSRMTSWKRGLHRPRQGSKYPLLAGCLQTIRHAAIRLSWTLLERGGQTLRPHCQPGH